ncbi:hypothetical protein WA026_010426 [Henosepilachna vigintioctopunctata]|uniref:Uncharacterized protein n=1 Tax=Henosepilachna vigintioctopunctata TaxID=420089 RepID=A0AAW1VD44_9CUCU
MWKIVRGKLTALRRVARERLATDDAVQRIRWRAGGGSASLNELPTSSLNVTDIFTTGFKLPTSCHKNHANWHIHSDRQLIHIAIFRGFPIQKQSLYWLALVTINHHVA